MVDRGELIAIVGASGSGQVDAAQHPVRAGRADRRHRPGRPATTCWRCRRASALTYRRHTVGFVWQQTGPQPAAVPDRARRTSTCRCAWPGTRPPARPRPRVDELLDLVGVGVLRRPAARADERRRAAAVRGRGGAWPTTPRCSSPTSRPASSTRRLRQQVFGALRDRQRRAGRDRRGRHPRPRRLRQVRRTVAIRDGRLLAEVRRTARLASDGVDRAGQPRSTRCSTGPAGCSCPQAFVDALELQATGSGSNLEPDHVEVHPTTTEEAPS